MNTVSTQSVEHYSGIRIFDSEYPNESTPNSNAARTNYNSESFANNERATRVGDDEIPADSEEIPRGIPRRMEVNVAGLAPIWKTVLRDSHENYSEFCCDDYMISFTFDPAKFNIAGVMEICQQNRIDFILTYRCRL